VLHLEGIPVSSGFGRGVAVIYDLGIERRIELPQHSISRSQVASECDRLDGALENSTNDLRQLEISTSGQPRLVESSGLMSAQSAMANDIAALVRQRIGQELVSVEHALDGVVAEFVSRLAQLENDYFRGREQDVRDVGKRMMRHLAGASPWTNKSLPPGSVIVARELLPSETVELAKCGIVAIISEYGGEFSHTAILARSLGIPAVTGVVDATLLIKPGTRLLVNGESGSVIESTDSELEIFESGKRDFDRRHSLIAKDESLPGVTEDGIEVSLLSNVCLPVEVVAVTTHNLAGVGLFRTEFLFIESHERPDFDLQVETYGAVSRSLGDLPLVIRTFDLGGDKLPPFLLSENSSSLSSLHLRGLRFSLAEERLMETQLHAILQVAQTSDVRILFPMVIGSDDFSRAIAAVDRAVKDLGVLRRPPLGAMIETPAALFALDEIMELADFVAIGTNDLTQYLLASDRALAQGTDDCSAMHPAVLRAIKQIVDAAESHRCPVCVCGEEAGNPDFACLLVGLGIRELSMTPSRSAAVRQAIRQIDSRTAAKVAGLALLCRTPQQVRSLFRDFAFQPGVGPSRSRSSSPVAVECGVTVAATQSIANAGDSLRTLKEKNQTLRSRIAESTAQLSEANQQLVVASREEQLAAVAFETYDSILITDNAGAVLRVNESFTKLTGYRSEEMVGKSPRLLRSAKQPKRFYRLMWQAARRSGYWQGESWTRRKNGTEFLQRLTITSVKNAAGNITHYVGIGQDLTSQKQGEVDIVAIRAAREVQRTLFPRMAPVLPGFEIAGAVHPAESVSGDCFDFIPLGKNVWGLLVADVSGHGLGPALLMAQAQASLRALAQSYSDPGELLTRVNQLFTATESGHFITMFLGRLDVATRSFTYQAAGHQGYLIGKDGAVRVLHATSIPVGLMPDIPTCCVPDILLKRGDILVIPTDGTEEAMSPAGQRFGRNQLFEVINSCRDQSAAQIVETLFRTARKFTGERPQLDDITVLILKVLPEAFDSQLN
jgi:phosphotransferase system enzyme I (PtsI)